MYVCICHAVTQAHVEAEVARGARTAEEIGERTGAGTGCGMCVRKLCRLLGTAEQPRGRITLQPAV
jgi:bacterioferritin-associated ferredoxin